MRILVLADIHSNWPALAAIDEDFDACLIIGDLVDYGTDPVPCIQWAQQNATAVIRGNHDHAVAQMVPVRPGNGYRRLALAARPIHWKVLDAVQMTWLARLPVTRHLSVGGNTAFLVHATPLDPMDEYLTCDETLWESRLQHIDADLVCVGHTHVPMHFRIGKKQVVNPGSVGQPRDGDPRSSYAVIEDGHVEIRRAEYDIGATIDHMKRSGFDAKALELAEAVLRTGGTDMSDTETDTV